jgi:hypothetical protein
MIPIHSNSSPYRWAGGPGPAALSNPDEGATGPSHLGTGDDGHHRLVAKTRYRIKQRLLRGSVLPQGPIHRGIGTVPLTSPVPESEGQGAPSHLDLIEPLGSGPSAQLPNFPVDILPMLAQCIGRKATGGRNGRQIRRAARHPGPDGPENP